MAVGDGVGFTVGEGEVVAGWLLLVAGVGTVGEGWAAGREAEALVDELAEAEGLGRAVADRNAPAVG
ncbi:hypothetical protein ABT095_07860 [Kitasatospora sp. NPDC002227]|uniref:hypothetical protein n=1 Tax=Kitasatospora sp. NPDC002227 TaxID=3154773 RepID=UPI00331800CA